MIWNPYDLAIRMNGLTSVKPMLRNSHRCCTCPSGLYHSSSLTRRVRLMNLKRQSETYMAAAVTRGCPASFVAMPGTSHYDIVFGLAKRDSPLANAVLEKMGLR